MIFFDPTESRKGTRLPQNVIEAGTPLNELEQLTGADILVSPLALPISNSKFFQRHIEAGMLFQRKTGRDAMNSIPHYDAILQRMLEHTTRPWLITIGDYKSSRESKVIVDGQEIGWEWNAWTGAKDWWQLHGGYIAELSRDGQLLQYLRQWEQRLSSDDWQEGTAKHVVSLRLPKQVIGDPDWVSVVLGLSIGFGQEKCEWLQENFYGLADFFQFFSDENNLKSALIKDTKGIGKSHFQKVKKRLGLRKTTALEVVEMEHIERKTVVSVNVSEVSENK